MAIEKRNVPATDFTQKQKPWKLTSSQWVVYYWLLAHSNWNSFQKEEHYYIYKNKIVNARIMRDCGIKTQNTIRAALAKLEEVGAIGKSSYADAYELYFPIIYVPLDIRIIRVFLAFNKHIDSGQMILLYSILRRIFIFDRGVPVDFTASGLCALLGKAKQTVGPTGIILMLALFEHFKLIELVRVPYTNTMGTKCIRYTLTSIKDTIDDSVLAELNFDEEISASWAESVWKRIM